MIILTSYEVKKRNGIYYVTPNEPPVCPTCRHSMTVRDSKRRQVIVGNGIVHTYRLRRLRCPHCKVIHLELPDIFVPYKRYSRQVIRMAIAGSVTGCPAENSTIYRWSKQQLTKDLKEE